MDGSMKINYSTVADDKLASYRYRIQIPAKHLREMGHEVSIGKPEPADIGVFSKHFNARDYEIARQPVRYRKVVFDICDYHLDGPYSDHYERMMDLADTITVATEEMARSIEDETGHVSKVIPDPYEFPEKTPKFTDEMRLLWFGHPSNLNPLRLEIEKGNLGGYWLKVISQPNAMIPCIPWSMEAMENGLDECDIVIIPQEDTQRNRCKGANRMIESIRSGRFVIANAMPAYEQFKDWMYIGDIQEGLKWAETNKKEITDRITEAQKYVRQTFCPKAISLQWQSALMSGVGLNV